MRQWLGQAFCETKTDGTAGSPSFSRLAAGITVGFTLGWITTAVAAAAYHNFKFHDAPPWPILPDSGTLQGLALFIGTLYGINRITAFFGTK